MSFSLRPRIRGAGAALSALGLTLATVGLAPAAGAVPGLDAELQGDRLVVNGTSGADHFEVVGLAKRHVQVTAYFANGDSVGTVFPGANSVVVNSWGGDDVIEVFGIVYGDVTVRPGGGDDTLLVDAGIGFDLEVIGGWGDLDTVIDSSEIEGDVRLDLRRHVHSVKIRGTWVGGDTSVSLAEGEGIVEFDSVHSHYEGSLNVSGGGGSDLFKVRNGSIGTTLSIDGGGHHDAVLIGEQGAVEAFSTWIHGGDGNDQIEVDQLTSVGLVVRGQQHDDVVAIRNSTLRYVNLYTNRGDDHTVVVGTDIDRVFRFYGGMDDDIVSMFGVDFGTADVHLSGGPGHDTLSGENVVAHGELRYVEFEAF